MAHPASINLDTFVEQHVIRLEGPMVLGPERIVAALCEDGKQRTARCHPHGADTFFTIPARIKARGRTITGFVTTDDSFCKHCGIKLYDHAADLACPQGETRFEQLGVWLFIANASSINSHLVKPTPEPTPA